MSKSSYMPDSREDRAKWFENLIAQLPEVKSKCNLTTDDVTGATNDCVANRYLLNQLYGVRIFEHQCSTFYVTMCTGEDIGTIAEYPIYNPITAPTVAVGQGIFKRVRLLVKKIKSHKNYTKDIGVLLGIEGSTESKEDLENITTTLSNKQSGGNVLLKFVKGKIDGIRLECKRGDETEFTLLASLNKVNYTDKRPNLVPDKPEIRLYRAWCFINDEIVGKVSVVLSVTVTPV